MAYAKVLVQSNTTQIINTAVLVTIAAVTDVPRHIQQLTWSLDDNPSDAVNLSITSGGVTLFSFDIIQGGPGFIHFNEPGLPGTAGATMVVTLAADPDAIGKLNVLVDNS